MLCVLILYISGGTYSLKSTPNDRFFEKLLMAILFTLRVFARNLLRGNRRRKLSVFCFVFWNYNEKVLVAILFIIGHYNPSVRIMTLASHTTYVECVLQFRGDSEWQLSVKPFHGNSIYSQSFYQQSAERSCQSNIFSYFILLEMTSRLIN